MSRRDFPRTRMRSFPPRKFSRGLNRWRAGTFPSGMCIAAIDPDRQLTLRTNPANQARPAVVVRCKHDAHWAARFVNLREDMIMKVKEVMTPGAKAIWLTESLSAAAQSMWENDCGILPVIKDGNKVVGLITDRDICMATAINDRKPSNISVEEVMNGTVFSASPEDDVNQALNIMREHKIRRLPVVNKEGDLQGILSMNDIVLHAKVSNGKKQPIDYATVVKTYQAICEHPLPMTQAAAAATT